MITDGLRFNIDLMVLNFSLEKQFNILISLIYCAVNFVPYRYDIPFPYIYLKLKIAQ
jgi:hypothetical protein